MPLRPPAWRRAAVSSARDCSWRRQAPAASRALYNCSKELYGNYTDEASVKVYVVYEDAWWRTTLGLLEGEVRSPSSAPSDPPVYIRYHDGPVNCDGGAAAAGGGGAAAAGGACRGALLVQYAHTLEDGGGFYMRCAAPLPNHRLHHHLHHHHLLVLSHAPPAARYQQRAHDPLTVLPASASAEELVERGGDDDAAEKAGQGGTASLPALLHAKLMAMHAAALRAAGVPPERVAPPTAAVLGFWPHASSELRHPASRLAESAPPLGLRIAPTSHLHHRKARAGPTCAMSAAPAAGRLALACAARDSWRARRAF